MSRITDVIPKPVRQEIKRQRGKLFEWAGSQRYAMPAQFGLDQSIMRHLPDRPGCFLEIGANDGYTASNTYFLEKYRGWHGILIEPLPKLYARCQATRTASQVFNYACVDRLGQGDLEIEDLGLKSVVLGQQSHEKEAERLEGGHRLRVRTTTLSSIIDRSGAAHIDLMVIDVEGAELSVLGGLDLTRHTPDLLVVETDSPAAVSGVLDGRMRMAEKLTHHDYLYQRT